MRVSTLVSGKLNNGQMKMKQIRVECVEKLDTSTRNICTNKDKRIEKKWKSEKGRAVWMKFDDKLLSLKLDK